MDHSMKTETEVQKKYKELWDLQSDLQIKQDLASKMHDQSAYSMLMDKIYKITIQMRELAWVLDGEVTKDV